MAKYIYICSANFSGSTLLDFLIGSHSRIESLGEISHLPKDIFLNTLCTCGKHVKSCSVWIKVINIMSEKLGIDINNNPYLLNLGNIRSRVNNDVKNYTSFYIFKRKLKSVLRYAELRFGTSFFSSLITDVHKGIMNNFLLYDTIRDVLGVDAVVDSSKDYLKAVDLYKKAPEDVRIILLIRDGRAVFFSGIKRNFTYRKCLNSWKNLYTRALPLIKKHVAPEHVLQIRYEDLVNNTHSELARICNFAGFLFEEEMIDFARKTHHITAGNDIRFCKSSTIRSPDMIWKEKMTKEDLKYFEKKAGALNQAFGYF